MSGRQFDIHWLRFGQPVVVLALILTCLEAFWTCHCPSCISASPILHLFSPVFRLDEAIGGRWPCEGGSDWTKHWRSVSYWNWNVILYLKVYCQKIWHPGSWRCPSVAASILRFCCCGACHGGFAATVETCAVTESTDLSLSLPL